MKIPVSLKRSSLTSVKRKPPLSLEVKKVLKALIVTLTCLIVGFGVVFLFSRSSSAQKGYLLRGIELQNANLRSEHEDLSQQVLEAQSYKILKSSKTIQRMEENINSIFVTPKKEARK